MNNFLTESTTKVNITQQYLPDRPDLNYSLRSRYHNKTLICKTSELNDRDFIIRNLYKSIASNFHGTYSPYFVFLHFCIFFIFVTFVAVAFLTAFYRNGDDEMT